MMIEKAINPFEQKKNNRFYDSIVNNDLCRLTLSDRF